MKKRKATRKEREQAKQIAQLYRVQSQQSNDLLAARERLAVMEKRIEMARREICLVERRHWKAESHAANAEMEKCELELKAMGVPDGHMAMDLAQK